MNAKEYLTKILQEKLGHSAQKSVELAETVAKRIDFRSICEGPKEGDERGRAYVG